MEQNLRFRTSLLITPCSTFGKVVPAKKGGVTPFHFLHTNCRTDGTYGPRLYRSRRRGGRPYFFNWAEHWIFGLCMTYLTLSYFNFSALNGSLRGSAPHAHQSKSRNPLDQSKTGKRRPIKNELTLYCTYLRNTPLYIPCVVTCRCKYV